MSQLVYVTNDDCHFCEHGRDMPPVNDAPALAGRTLLRLHLGFGHKLWVIP